MTALIKYAGITVVTDMKKLDRRIASIGSSPAKYIRDVQIAGISALYMAMKHGNTSKIVDLVLAMDTNSNRDKIIMWVCDHIPYQKSTLSLAKHNASKLDEYHISLKKPRKPAQFLLEEAASVDWKVYKSPNAPAPAGITAQGSYDKMEAMLVKLVAAGKLAQGEHKKITTVLMREMHIVDNSSKAVAAQLVKDADKATETKRVKAKNAKATKAATLAQAEKRQAANAKRKAKRAADKAAKLLAETAALPAVGAALNKALNG